MKTAKPEATKTDKTQPDKTQTPKPGDKAADQTTKTEVVKEGDEATAEPPVIGKGIVSFMERANNSHGRKKDETTDKKGKKGEKAKPAEVTKAEETETEKPKPKVKPQAPARPVLDEATAEVLGTAIGKTLAAEREKEVKETKEEKDDFVLTPKQQRRATVLKQMEEQFSDDTEYKGLHDRYVGSLKEWSTYADNWKKEHAGEEFDEDATEHQDLRERLAAVVEYEDEDYNAAQTALIARQERQQFEKDQNARMTRYERAEKLRDEKPKIEKLRIAAANQLIAGMGDDFKETVKEDGSLDLEKLKAIGESDPVRYDTVLQCAQATEIFTEEAFKIMSLLTDNLARTAVTESTPKDVAATVERHKFITDFVLWNEGAFKNQESDKQLDAQGRQFVTSAEYAQMNAKQREKHWTFSHEDVGTLLSAHFSKVAREKIGEEDKKFESRAVGRGLIKPGETKGAKTGATAGDKKNDEETTEDNDEKPVSPTFVPSPRLAARKSGEKEPPKTALGRFVARANNRR